MTVQSLTLVDFRSAAKVEFVGEHAFDSQINIFYGDNGAGKSTLLDALSIALSLVPAKLRTLGGAGASIRDADIRNSAQTTEIAITATHLVQMAALAGATQQKAMKG